METRNIKISLETATRWFNGTDKELKDLAVQTYPELVKKELPKSWEELGKISGWFSDHDAIIGNVDYVNTVKENRTIFATKEQAEASIALAQLSQLMKVYNDGWVPDWENEEYEKYCIAFVEGKISELVYYSINSFLCFKDEKTRDLFYNNFRDLIEQAKPLL